jgi:O-antigen/teichoic acid export membrane protein
MFQRLPQTRLNLLANFIGLAVVAALNVFFVPVFIRILGIQAYGLIGFYAVLQGSLQIMDLGLSTTANRELARYLTRASDLAEARSFVLTVEIPYTALGIIMGGGLVSLAPVLGEWWIQATAVPAATVSTAVALMGVVFACQWPVSLYQGGLLGLQRQLVMQSINVVASLLKNIGVVYWLQWTRPSIELFFVWQIGVALVHVLALRTALWQNLPIGPRSPCFDLQLLRKVWTFAAGMSGIGVLGLILSQMDKLLVSKLLPLDMFGYYSVATVLSGGLNLVLIMPIFNALFPRFSQLAVSGERTALAGLYHRGTQFMAVAVWPVVVCVVFFAGDVLRLWIGDPLAAEKATVPLQLLVAGTAINGLMVLPYMLQLAYGWTRLGISITLIQVIIFIPLAWWFIMAWGATGAAAAWLLINATYFLVGVPLTHQRLLSGELGRWLREDVGLPLLAIGLAAGGVLVLRMTVPQLLPIWGWLSLAYPVALLAALTAAPIIRRVVVEFGTRNLSCPRIA